jgi:hypothetical protein
MSHWSGLVCWLDVQCVHCGELSHFVTHYVNSCHILRNYLPGPDRWLEALQIDVGFGGSSGSDRAGRRLGQAEAPLPVGSGQISGPL